MSSSPLSPCLPSLGSFPGAEGAVLEAWLSRGLKLYSCPKQVKDKKGLLNCPAPSAGRTLRPLPPNLIKAGDKTPGPPCLSGPSHSYTCTCGLHSLLALHFDTLLVVLTWPLLPQYPVPCPADFSPCTRGQGEGTTLLPHCKWGLRVQGGGGRVGGRTRAESPVTSLSLADLGLLSWEINLDRGTTLSLCKAP